MLHVSVTCKEVNFDVVIDKENGDITLGRIPEGVTKAAWQDLKYTFTATDHILNNRDFWKGKAVQVLDQQAMLLARSIKDTAHKNRALKDKMIEKFVELSAELAYKQFECEINTPVYQLKHNTPLTEDRKGIKCNNIGQDFCRTITQREFNIFFGDPSFVNLSIDQSLKESDLRQIKSRAYCLIYNMFKIVYGRQFKSSGIENGLKKLKKELDETSMLTLMGELIAKYFFASAASPDPRERAAIMLIFLSLSQELKNNMAEPFISAKPILKIDSPYLATDRSKQEVTILKKGGKILFKRTIIFEMPHDIDYKPCLKAEIDVVTGKIEKVSIDRKLHFTSSIVSEEKASACFNKFEKAAKEHNIQIGLSLMDKNVPKKTRKIRPPTPQLAG